jgi:t-SNARE complex subunit (syntaxin)
VFERDFEGLFEQIERERVDALQQRDEASEQAIEEALEDVVEEPVDQDPQIELSSGPLPPRP